MPLKSMSDYSKLFEHVQHEATAYAMLLSAVGRAAVCIVEFRIIYPLLVIIRAHFYSVLSPIYQQESLYDIKSSE